MTTLIKLIRVFIVLVLCGKNAQSQKRIIGGSDANLGEFPYITMIIYNHGGFRGGAAIINENWVLTAAHCIYEEICEYLQIVSGALFVDDRTNVHNLELCIAHPDFSAKPTHHDIGLIKVVKRFVFSKTVQPIPLPSSPVQDGDIAVAVGWGAMIHKENPDPAHRLKLLYLELLNAKTCGKLHDLVIFPDEICTFTMDGEGVCNGDSGGPLASNGVLVGIVSHGKPCAKGLPDAYSSVYHHLNWIKSTVKSK